MANPKNDAAQDQAWEHIYDQRPTNYKLKVGQQIRLRAQTLGSNGEVVPAGSTGVVTNPRQVRRRRPPGVSSHYLVVADVQSGHGVVSITVPHGAVRLLKKP